MKKNYILSTVISLLIITSCKIFDQKIDGVQLRILNNSDIDFDDIQVNGIAFGKVEKYKFSDYKRFDELYRYGAITISANDSTFGFGVLDYAGEIPLVEGYYTYMISVDYENYQIHLEFCKSDDIPGKTQPHNKNRLIEERINYIANSCTEDLVGNLLIVALKRKIQTINPTISIVPLSRVRYLKNARTYSAERSKILLMTNENGSELWRKYIPTDYNYYQDYGYDQIIQANDGSIYIAGSGEYLEQNGYDMNGIVIKLSQTGQHIWTKNYGVGNYTYIRDIFETDTDNLILTGKQNENTYFLYLDKDGNLLFNLPLDHTFRGESILEVDDGAIIAGDDLGDVYAEPNSGILKIDANGNTIWHQSSSNSIYSMIETSTKDLVIVGSANYQNAFIQKLSSEGELLWRSDIVFDDPYIYSRGYSITETSNGNYLISGLLDEENALFNTDASGVLLWTKSFKNDNIYLNTYKNSVISTIDGNNLLIGSKEDQIFLAKINNNGETSFQKLIGD